MKNTPVKTTFPSPLKALSLALKKSFLKQCAYSIFTASCAGVCAAYLCVASGVLHAAQWFFWGSPPAATLVCLFLAYRKNTHVWTQPHLLAQHIEKKLPSLGSSVQTAVFFTQQSNNLPALTETWAQEHIQHTYTHLNTYPWPQLVHTWNAQGTLLHKYLCLAGMALATALSFALPEHRQTLAHLLSNGDTFLATHTPLVADVHITYQFPSYTRKKTYTTEGSDGSIEALKNSRIRVHATSHVKTHEAWIQFFNTSHKPLEKIPVRIESDGHTLSWEITLQESGSYQWIVQPARGAGLREHHTHPISVTHDQKPLATLVHPATDVELRDNLLVDVLWQTSDDFGLTNITLVVTQTSTQQTTRIPFTLSSLDNTRAEGRYAWDLKPYNLSENDTLLFHIEAQDNQEPQHNISASIERKVQLFNPRKNHARLIEQQRLILDMLVDQLALDIAPHNTTQPQKIREHLEATHAKLVSTVKEIHTDPLTPPETITTLTHIQEHLHKRIQQRIFRATPTLVQQLEADISYLDDLLAIKQLQELKHEARGLLQDHRRLSEALERYKQTQDPAAHEALMKQMVALRNNMVETLQKMASIKKNLPSEYRNTEAHTMHQLSEQMQTLDQLLQEGKLEEASKILEELSQTLENMAKNIEQEEKSYGDEKYEPIRKDLASFANDFKKIEEQQKKLEERTQSLLKKSHEKSIQKTASSMENLIKKTRALTSKAALALEEYAEDEKNMPARNMRFLNTAGTQLLDLDSLLQSKDLSNALTISENILNHLKQGDFLTFNTLKPLKKSTEYMQEVHGILQKLFEEPEKNLSEQEKNTLQQTQKQQAQLKKQADDVVKKMKGLSENIPLFGESTQTTLEKAGQSMQEASSSLQKKQLHQAHTHQKRANDALAKLRQDLEQASQKSGQGGLPLPLGTPQNNGSQNEGSSNNDNNTQVAIPGADHSSDKSKLRQKLIEASRQKTPEQYEEAVRRYYEDLIH